MLRPPLRFLFRGNCITEMQFHPPLPPPDRRARLTNTHEPLGRRLPTDDSDVAERRADAHQARERRVPVDVVDNPRDRAEHDEQIRDVPWLQDGPPAWRSVLRQRKDGRTGRVYATVWAFGVRVRFCLRVRLRLRDSTFIIGSSANS